LFYCVKGKGLKGPFSTLLIRSVITLIVFCLSFGAASAAPGLSIELGAGTEGVSTGIQIMVLLTVLSVAPSILLMTTSFVRFVIVFGMLRTALGLGQLPPTQVLIGLSLILTFVVMQPTFQRINDDALQPLLSREINEIEFLDKAKKPLRDFMLAQTSETEIGMALKVSNRPQPETVDELPSEVLIMSFMLSELKKAFQIGFMLFLPFVVIDMISATALVSIGLMFLPPTTISMPFKVVLFILIDGWSILSEGLVRGFN
jgi:flagellar biosynthetic protein FliP